MTRTWFGTYTTGGLNKQDKDMRLNRSQLKWFGHLVRMSASGCLWRFSGLVQLGRPRTHWKDYVSHLALGASRDPPGGAGKLRFSDVWNSMLSLLPPGFPGSWISGNRWPKRWLSVVLVILRANCFLSLC